MKKIKQYGSNAVKHDAHKNVGKIKKAQCPGNSKGGTGSYK